MTTDQIVLLFFGLPLAVLVFGLRRGLGARGLGLVVLGSLGVGLYALALEAILAALHNGLRLSGSDAAGPFLDLGHVRRDGPLFFGGALLGALAGILVRLRGRGSTP